MVQTMRFAKPIGEDVRTPAEKREALRALLDVLEAENREPDAEEHEYLVYTLMGSYADILPSSEDFMRRKQLEIELEDKGWRPPASDS